MTTCPLIKSVYGIAIYASSSVHSRYLKRSYGWRHHRNLAIGAEYILDFQKMATSRCEPPYHRRPMSPHVSHGSISEPELFKMFCVFFWKFLFFSTDFNNFWFPEKRSWHSLRWDLVFSDVFYGRGLQARPKGVGFFLYANLLELTPTSNLVSHVR